MKAEETFKIRDRDLLAENFEREFKSFKLKVRVALLPHVPFLSLSQISSRMTTLSSSWQSAKVVRTREKLSFFFGVMSLLFSALIFGLAPQYVTSISLLIRFKHNADGFTFLTRSSYYIFFLCAPTHTKSAPGIISSLIYAIMATSSTSCTFGCCLRVRPSSSLATVFPMDLLRARSLHGAIAWYSMTKIK
jgi:hypothetical protein